jgi:DNA invertase Pin-like site-specific DNA recombinase
MASRNKDNSPIFTQVLRRVELPRLVKRASGDVKNGSHEQIDNRIREMARKISGLEYADRRYIAYYRVSTLQQGASGLGLEAQREAVGRYVFSVAGEIIAEFEEIESGKRSENRPKLIEALAHARATRATLVIAKLDRLARNVAFISSLMDAGVDFIAADMPMANRLTVHVLAAVAEHEREMISVRTKAALAAAKARGVKLGNPKLRAGDRESARAACRVRVAKANKIASSIMPYIEAARSAGCRTLAELADALTARGIRTPGGKSKWSAEQVRRITARLSMSARSISS